MLNGLFVFLFNKGHTFTRFTTVLNLPKCRGQMTFNYSRKFETVSNVIQGLKHSPIRTPVSSKMSCGQPKLLLQCHWQHPDKLRPSYVPRTVKKLLLQHQLLSKLESVLSGFVRTDRPAIVCFDKFAEKKWKRRELMAVSNPLTRHWCRSTSTPVENYVVCVRERMSCVQNSAPKGEDTALTECLDPPSSHSSEKATTGR